MDGNVYSDAALNFSHIGIGVSRVSDNGVNMTPWNNITIPKGYQSGPNKNCLVYDFLIEAMLMGILCLFGFAGNTLSMICLWKDKSKSATPFLLISLEIADTLFLVTVLILRVLTSIHQFTGWFTPLMVVFPYIGSYVFPCALIAMTSTIYLTILVTVNRYIAVCRPYEASNLCSIQQARKQVVLVWILCILYNIPRFFEFHVKTKYNAQMNTTITRSFPSDMSKSRIYKIIYNNSLYFIVMFLVPLITLIILNYKLIMALRETQKRRAKLITHDPNRSEDDITLTLIIIIFMFCLTQTPALVTQVLLSTLPPPVRICPSHFFYYERVSDLLVVANSASNFIVYCFCSRRFRQILIMLICKKKIDSPENTASHPAAVKHYKPVATKDDARKNGHTEITAV